MTSDVVGPRLPREGEQWIRHPTADEDGGWGPGPQSGLYAVTITHVGNGFAHFTAGSTGVGSVMNVEEFVKRFHPADQPSPTVGEGVSVQDLVIADLEERKAVGLERYGTLLYPRNGRDMLRDAYDEALDLCVYLRGALEERGGG